jgi:hypothetical protein
MPSMAGQRSSAAEGQGRWASQLSKIARWMPNGAVWWALWNGQTSKEGRPRVVGIWQLEDHLR